MNYFFNLRSSGYESFINVFRKTPWGSSVEGKLYGVTADQRRAKFRYKSLKFDGSGLFWSDEKLAQNFLAYCFLDADFPDFFESSELIPLPKFNATTPEFRAEIIIKSDQYTARYLGEYPELMTRSNGIVVSPIYSVCSQFARSCLLYVKSISDTFDPITENNGVIFDPVSKQVKRRFCVQRNTLSVIDVTEFTSPLCGDLLVLRGLSAIPIYLNIFPSGMLSVEHTHPPHSWMGGANKFEAVRAYKTQLEKLVWGESL